MEPSAPPPDHPVWGPPGDPLITQGPLPRRQAAPRRRHHPAQRGRRLAGLATLASSAAIVGYMATATAEKPSNQSAVTPVVQQPIAVTPATTAVVPTTPTTVATQPAVTATPTTQADRTRQAPPTQPNSSSHGS